MASATRTRAVTSYAVGGNRFWMLFFPVLRWAIRRNYHRLMAEDVPLRERRGVLRSWGYTFRGDDGPRDIRASLAIQADHVQHPDAGSETTTLPPVAVATIPEQGWALVGRSDHLGLKLQREGRQVVAYPRMCPHEGADIDEAPAEGRCLVCPWHGRRLEPVAVLDLDEAAPKASSGTHELRIEDDHVHITVVSEAPGADPAGPRP